MTADVQYAINKCWSLGSGQQLILHGNLSAISEDFSPHMAVLRRHSSAEYELPVLYVTRAPQYRQYALRPAVNPLRGCSSGKPVQEPIGVRFVLEPSSIS